MDEQTVLLDIGFPLHFQRNTVLEAERWLAEQYEAHPDNADIEAAFRTINTLASLYRFRVCNRVYIGEAQPADIGDGYQVPVYNAQLAATERLPRTMAAWLAMHSIKRYALGETPEDARHEAFRWCRENFVQPVIPFGNLGRLPSIQLEWEK